MRAGRLSFARLPIALPSGGTRGETDPEYFDRIFDVLVLDEHTSEGVFDPEGAIPIVPPVQKYLTDADLQKKMLAAETTILINEALRKGNGEARARAMAPMLGLMTSFLEDDKMDEAEILYERLLTTEYFFDNPDPSGSRFDVHLSPDAANMFQLEVLPNSAAAHDVIVLLNEVAQYHKDTGRVTVDYEAIIMVNARAALTTSDVIRQLYHVEEGYTWLGVAAGFLGGMAEGFGDAASGIFHMALNPQQTLEGLKAMIVNWDDTLALIWNQGAEIIHNWPNMTPQEKANFMGQLAVEVLMSLPARARQAGRVGEAAQDAVRIHMDKAARGLQIIERTGVPLSPKAASELAHQMEKLEVTSYDEMVEVIDGLDEYLPCRLTNRAGSLAVIISARIQCPPDMAPKEFSKIIEMLSSQIDNHVPEDLRNPTLRGLLDAKLGRLSTDTWISPAGLHYTNKADGENTLLHMMRHCEDDTSKPLQGIFREGRIKAPSIVDLAWRKVTQRPQDIRSVTETRDEHGVHRSYIIDMRDRYNLQNPIGSVGGSYYANKAKPKACFLKVVILNGVVLETAYPYRTAEYRCNGDNGTDAFDELLLN